ncbi:intestinal cell kinase, isoform CRA_c [Rattus norvegicus]|uniref:Intestinal cell kinase, isoform CRA_c n=1 Tax=Rattus norvegicus TaxID=10116 RepID=A6I1H6_RAT|nr:intestinal cell kinase, isoform CRA_c [Rattus norvegicus]
MKYVFGKDMENLGWHSLEATMMCSGRPRPRSGGFLLDATRCRVWTCRVRPLGSHCPCLPGPLGCTRRPAVIAATQEVNEAGQILRDGNSGTSAYPEKPANKRNSALFDSSGQCSAQAEGLHS